ncbi:hypothetical protein ILUMI_19362 [Ignelater luminosus]|uniref:Uncharacterized protein n=1 Tax=Ignelater luminosus TaxID=2038154 RepID=A0A8K0CKP0_IGNLU|nr:hypothetical protein ILUMI_19362 [Ignelater luminosus]
MNARLTDYDVAGLADIAFTKAARLEIAQTGFRCTGIQPFNREAPSPTVVPENEPEPPTNALPVTSTTFQEAVPGTSANVKKVIDVLKICGLFELPQTKHWLQEKELFTKARF